jgi:hypothetical protein
MRDVKHGSIKCNQTAFHFANIHGFGRNSLWRNSILQRSARDHHQQQIRPRHYENAPHLQLVRLHSRYLRAHARVRLIVLRLKFISASN